VNLASVVKSGDSTNCEAKAAMYYWKHIFPDFLEFKRERYGLPPNNLLNYGYAILRALVAGCERTKLKSKVESKSQHSFLYSGFKYGCERTKLISKVESKSQRIHFPLSPSRVSLRALGVLPRKFYLFSSHLCKTKNCEPDGIYFITITCFNWLPLFNIVDSYHAVYKWFHYLKLNNHFITGYVIMPNHLHLLIAFF
jgi:hypothetical protein